MNVSSSDLDHLMAQFIQACKDAGAKLTHQRTEIYREVAHSMKHPDAEKICEGVRKRIPTISLDTVYRTLWWLKDLGLITMLGPQRERARFDANLSHHHHFVCTQCGLTRDFYSPELDNLKMPVSLSSIGQVDKMQIEAIGLCQQCAFENERNNTSSQKEE